MKITKKLVKVGSSLGLIIDNPIVKKLNLEKGNFVELEIKKVN